MSRKSEIKVCHPLSASSLKNINEAPALNLKQGGGRMEEWIIHPRSICFPYYSMIT